MTGKSQRMRALERQISRLDRRLADLAAHSSRLAWARLLVFTGGAVGSIAAALLIGLLVGGIAAVAALSVFIFLARQHRRVNISRDQHLHWQRIKAVQVARMQLDWEHMPAAQVTTLRSNQPLERDLDLVGEFSLHRLLDTVVAQESSDRLRDWLADPIPDPVRTQTRQALVRDLIPLTIFRDRLHLYGALDPHGKVRRRSGTRLVKWTTAQAPTVSLANWLTGLTLLSTVTVLLFVLNGAGMLPPVWQITLLVYAALYLWRAQRLGDPFAQAQALNDPLRDLQAVFSHLERHRYRSGSALRELCTPFLDDQHRPSAELARLTRVLSLASFRGNPWLWVAVSAIIPWDLFVMHMLNRRRAALADLLPRWLDVWYELEALCALANFGYLNPDYTFPVLLPDAQDAAALLEAQAIGHPLIPDADRVCNDFAFEQSGELALITGSNMSGKSTFLRTLGINLCLTNAGGPVAARALRVVPLRLHSCVRVTDSVTDGISYFYAEVKCLKALLAALQADHPYPLFYLIDEIFRGTNNRERLTGSRAYIRALVGQRGVGVLSTHDLELVHLADEIPAIKNYHFTESIGAGRLLFDYTLRPGPCPTTNALKIMTMEGLPVPPEQDAAG